MATREKPIEAGYSAAPADRARAVWQAFGEWTKQFYHRNFDEVLGGELAEDDMAEAREHVPQLVQPAIERVQGQVSHEEVARFLEEAGKQHELKKLRRLAKEEPQWTRILDCLSQELPVLYRERVLPPYVGDRSH